MKPTPTIERLHELFSLEEGGRLVRRISTANRVKAGDSVGCITANGYLRVTIDSASYYVHRIVFALEHSRYPIGDIDHLNGIRTDNRPDNLREVTRRENLQNRQCHRDGQLPGCWYNSRKRNWRATAYLNGTTHYLGVYRTEIEAHAAYRTFLYENGL